LGAVRRVIRRRSKEHPTRLIPIASQLYLEPSAPVCESCSHYKRTLSLYGGCHRAKIRK
jgi:hypothetical protein